MTNSTTAKLVVFVIAAVALMALPLVLQATGSNSWVRIVDVALLYVLLALGLNIVVGFMLRTIRREPPFRARALDSNQPELSDAFHRPEELPPCQ